MDIYDVLIIVNIPPLYMEESHCSSFLKFLETVFCDGRRSSGERTLCVLTSATLCEVVANYLLSHDFFTSCLYSCDLSYFHVALHCFTVLRPLLALNDCVSKVIWNEDFLKVITISLFKAYP